MKNNELSNVVIFSRSTEHAKMIIDFWKKQGIDENWEAEERMYYGMFNNHPLKASSSLIFPTELKSLKLEEAEQIANDKMNICCSVDKIFAMEVKKSNQERIMSINTNGDIYIRGVFIKNDKEIADIINRNINNYEQI